VYLPLLLQLLRRESRPNSEARGAGSFGVAKFVRDDGRYSWEFLPAAGSTFTDRSEAGCVQ
jgi:hypothetical protein